MSTYEKRASLAARRPGALIDAGVQPSEAAPLRAFSNRYEVKYLLGAHQLADVQSALRDFLVSDANGCGERGYYVHSIYFDSPNLDFLREKFEGQLTRLKPRIRAYRPTMDGPPSALFLELKGRHARIVHKRRCPIEQPLAELLLTQSPVHPNGWSDEHTVLGEFQYMSHRMRLIPAVSVLYHRTAYFGTLWPNLRITFDRLVLCSPATGLTVPSEDFYQAMPFGQSVMELKYNDKMPAILRQRLNSLGLQQRTFSKYAVSVERCFRGLNGKSSLH